MSVILQISDTHFGTEQPPVVEALLALAWQLQPDLIVLSGDVTQRARPAEFAAAAAFVARLPPGPRLVVPGNHDIPLFNVLQRVIDPFQGYRQCLGSALEDSRRLPDVFMTGVNSVRAWRHKHGSLSPEQIEAVAERLRRAHALSSGRPKLWMSRRVSACAPSRVSMMLATSPTVFSGMSIRPLGWGV